MIAEEAAHSITALDWTADGYGLSVVLPDCLHLQTFTLKI